VFLEMGLYRSRIEFLVMRGGCPPLNDPVNDINLVPKMGQIIKVHRPVSSVPISGLYHRPLLEACK
jgi:hypothetical protein